MDKKEVVNVDLVDVPHIRLEVEDEERLEKQYERWIDFCNDYDKAGVSDFYKMRNKFESCFIVYRESMPDMMIYAQE